MCIISKNMANLIFCIRNGQRNVTEDIQKSSPDNKMARNKARPVMKTIFQRGCNCCYSYFFLKIQQKKQQVITMLNWNIKAMYVYISGLFLLGTKPGFTVSY